MLPFFRISNVFLVFFVLILREFMPAVQSENAYKIRTKKQSSNETSYLFVSNLFGKWTKMQNETTFPNIFEAFHFRKSFIFQHSKLATRKPRFITFFFLTNENPEYYISQLIGYGTIRILKRYANTNELHPFKMFSYLLTFSIETNLRS